MIFETQLSSKKWIEKEYDKAMKELEKFWGIKWEENKPRVFLMENRKTIDAFRRKKTKPWQVACISNMNIYILSPENYEKESSFKYSKEKYLALLKHELCHDFFKISCENKGRVIWLDEGIADYFSKRISFMKKPKKFSLFLEAFHEHKPKVNEEAGFAVELLVEKYGKEKIIKLVNKLKRAKTKETFEQLFKQIYDFELNYENFNEMLK